MTAMDIKYTIKRTLDSGVYQVYDMYANFADIEYQDLVLGNSNQYRVGTPANPAMNTYTTLAAALADFLSAIPQQTVDGFNTLFGTSNTLGNMVVIDKQIQDAINAAASSPPSFGLAPNFSAVTTAGQISTSRSALVNYEFPGALALSLLTGQSVTATLKYADNSGMSTNVVTADVSSVGASGLAGLAQTNSLKLTGEIPPGKYRQVTFATTGGATTPATLTVAQEVLFG